MLILGFDADCGTCSEIAGRVEERVGDKLAVRNLNDPELMAWREVALAEDAEWAPTLFEVDGNKVRAWTGTGMALPLSKELGLASTWQLMQALGEMRSDSGLDEETAIPATGMTRGKFLKGVGGAALAMSIMSGTGALAAPAMAAQRTPRPTDIVDVVQLTGTQATQQAQRARLNADTRLAMHGNLPSLSGKRTSYRYRLRNGMFAYTTAFYLGEGGWVTNTITNRPIGNRATSVSKILKPEVPGSGMQVTVRASEGGKLWRKQPSANFSTLASRGNVPLQDCPTVSSGGGAKWCTITTNQCVKKGFALTGKCSTGTYIAGATCIGSAAVATGVTLSTLGISGWISYGAAGVVCGGSLVQARQCCKQYAKVDVLCRR